jgi:hypothetical protein
VTLPEVAVVSETFHAKPLLGYLHANRHYYVLALSQNEVTLLGGTPHALEPVDFSTLPESLADALGRQEGGRRQLTVRGGMGGGQSPVFHGHGPGDEDRKEELSKFFRAIDQKLVEFLRDEKVPLVLAGVGYYHPIYREVSRYPYLLDEGVEGNVEREPADVIRAKAWPLVESLFAEELAKKRETFHTQAARRRADTDPEVVAQAVAHGRVRDLFVCEERHLWGRLDRDTGAVELHLEQTGTRDSDILDDLAEMTLLGGGEVWVLSPDEMPEGASVAAIFRY